MANVDRINVGSRDLPRPFCEDQGRVMGRNFTSIDQVISVARSYRGEERSVFLESFVSEAYQSRREMFPAGDVQEAKSVIRSFLEVSIQAQQDAQRSLQPQLPEFN